MKFHELASKEKRFKYYLDFGLSNCLVDVRLSSSSAPRNLKFSYQIPHVVHMRMLVYCMLVARNMCL